MFIELIIATSFITLLSLIGVIIFGKSRNIENNLKYIVPVAIGVFLGVVFFELIPETLEAGGEYGSFPIAIGFIGFYFLSFVLHTYHHHHDSDNHDDCEKNRAGASMLLFGDAVHNFSDGIVIATAFLINPTVGIATTIGIALHEIPQEIAEFSILLRAGYSKVRAALYNLLSAASVIIGAIITLIFAQNLEGSTWILTGLAAGNLLYIAASDLLPDVNEHSKRSGQFLHSFLATLFGIVGITILLTWSHGQFGEHDNESKVMQSH